MKKVFDRLPLAKNVVRFAVAALAFGLAVGVANAGQPSQGNPDNYNYVRGGGG